MDAPSLPANSRRLAVLAHIDNLASGIQRSNTWPLLIFLTAYLPLTILIARHKLLWDDEFFTLYLSKPDSFSGILDALRTGADQHPPPFYFLTHQIMAALGPSHLTFRLASIFGYGLFCICLFFLLRNRTSVLWALVGMLLPLTTGAYYYAAEGRGYALVLGFCSLALLSWQKAASHEKRLGWLCLLFGALVMAVASHYYAILFLIPLSIGELTRTYLRKRIDVLVWLSFCGAAVPPVVFLSTIRDASRYSAHFWAVPYWSRLFQFYPEFLGPSAPVFLLGTLVYLLSRSRVFRGSIANPEVQVSTSRLPLWEIVTWIGIAAIPVFAMFLAMFVTHGYIERYALSALIGAVLIVCYAGFHIARESRIVPFLVSLICLLFIGLQGVMILRAQSTLVSGLVDDIVFLAPHSAQPIVVSDVTLFHRASFYAPRQFARSLAYLSNPSYSVKYLQHDTVDKGLLDLRPWFPLNVVEQPEYVAEHPQFLVYGIIGGWDWLTFVFTPPAYKTEILDRLTVKLLLRVQKVAPGSAQPNLRQYLFSRVRTTGPSLCEEWFPGDTFCTAIEQKRRTTTLEDAIHPKIRVAW